MKHFKLQLLKQTLLISRKQEVYDVLQNASTKLLSIKNKFMKPNTFSSDSVV